MSGPPIVVDIDGTLLLSDLLIEGFFALVAANPIAAVLSLRTLWRHGIAAFKAQIASHPIDLATLPWNTPFVIWLEEQARRGRSIYLASAADRAWVEAIAKRFDWVSGWFASDGKTNLKGRDKADALREAFGEAGFLYAGNGTADLVVWQEAASVIVVNASARLRRRVRSRWHDATSIAGPGRSLATYARAIRVHQWLKNLLVMVPPLAAHQFTLGTAATCLVAFLSFSLCSSSSYVLNDLIDLHRDRAHRSKRLRPFASGVLPIRHGLAMVPLLLVAAFLLALSIGVGFVGVVSAYYVVTLAYSLYLKRRLMIDVVTLACLYGLRLAAGSVAVSVQPSTWLIAFSIFVFCSLALVKRCIEISGRVASGAGDPKGRAYLLSDLPMLEMLSAASAFTAVLVFALYIDSPAVAALYRSPERLWLLCVLLIYWLGRVHLLAHRGDMHDDPVVFAATDRTSLVCVCLGGLTFLASL